MSEAIRDEPSDLLPGKKGGCLKPLLITFGVLTVLLIALIAGVGVMMAQGYIPDTQLVQGHNLPQRIADDVRELAIEGDETIVWFYSAALRDVREDGNLLTDRHIVSWFVDVEDGLSLDRVPLEDIYALRVKFSESFATDTELTVWTDSVEEDGEEFVELGALLTLSNEKGLDQTFVRDLVSRAREAGASLEVIEIGGAVNDAEASQIEGAVRVVIDDIVDFPGESLPEDGDAK